MERFKRNEKGITLIALVVTIIVLLILAGVSITTLTGENGLITRTTGAVEKQKEAAALEEVKLAMKAVKLDKIVAGEDIALNIYTEETDVVGRNALEKELCNQDGNVMAVIEDEYLKVDYKGYEFLFDGNLAVTVNASNNAVITVTPIIATATIDSLSISSTIEGLDDLGQIQKRYYSVDNGATWKDGGTAATYTYDKLSPATTYNVKVRIVLKNNQGNVEGSATGTTLSLSTEVAKLPYDSTDDPTDPENSFFITNAAGDTITGINSKYISNGSITFNAENPADEFDGILVVPSTWNGHNVLNVGDNAFYGLDNIQKFYADVGVEKIKSNACGLCTGLTSVMLLGADEIEAAAFRSCTALNSITLNEGLKKIGYSAFIYCSNLTEVKLPSTLDDIYSSPSPFENCTGITKVTIPKCIIDGKYTLSGVFTNSYQAITEVNFNIDVNDTITAIGSGVFQGCTALTSINIPETVTRIGDYCYYGCTELTNITIPENVEQIGSYAFGNCTELRSVTLLGVEKIGACAFHSCTKLNSISLNEGITTIDYHAFRYCPSLASIVIPSTVTVFGNWYNVFEGCTVLTSIIVKQVKDDCSFAFLAPWGAPNMSKNDVVWQPNV